MPSLCLLIRRLVRKHHRIVLLLKALLWVVFFRLALLEPEGLPTSQKLTTRKSECIFAKPFFISHVFNIYRLPVCHQIDGNFGSRELFLVFKTYHQFSENVPDKEDIRCSQRQAHSPKFLLRAHSFTYLQIVGWFFRQPLVHQLQRLFVVASLDCIPYWSILPCHFVSGSLRREEYAK